MNAPVKHLLTLQELSKDDITAILNLARQMKTEVKRGQYRNTMQGRTLALIFQKPSTRTRISFEVGMYQLGGNVVFINHADILMGSREPVRDIARVLSRYVDATLIRCINHDEIAEFAAYSTVPVINGLSSKHHPCQALADVLTIIEHFESHSPVGTDTATSCSPSCSPSCCIAGKHICYIGDGNNVCHSLINCASLLGAKVTVCSPSGYDVDTSSVWGSYHQERSPQCAVENADVIYTDVWTSMGQEDSYQERLAAFDGFQINSQLLAHSRKTPVVLHCLPAHRNEEITDEVMESSNSLVFDQAENRLHVQKAVLAHLLGVR